MGRLSKHELEARRQRQERWLNEVLPRVRAARRPNSAYIEREEVVELLQHLSDGLTELLVARPLAPLPWLADYLRRACKLAYQVEHTPAETLVLEMHRKRRVIQRALRDTTLDEAESKRLIRLILALEQELKLSSRERRLHKADHVFLASEKPSEQTNWSIDTSKAPLFLDQTEKESSTAAEESSDNQQERDVEEGATALAEQLRLDLRPQRDLDSYFDAILDVVVHALVELLLVAPEGNAALWLVTHLRRQAGVEINQATPTATLPSRRRRSSVASVTISSSPLLFTTNYELTRKLESIKEDQHRMHSRLERMQEAHTALEQELALRNRFIAKLSASHLTTRTQAIMDGTPVFLDSQKHWVLPGFLLQPLALSSDELLGLRRAESFLMEEDERRWKFLLRAQQEYDAATLVQSVWRGRRAHRAYMELSKRRRRAAAIIQRNYFHYLFTRAVSLPRWCRPGREVVVAPSIAQKCAISFQFYAKKDFPAGNYRREPPGTSVAQLMELCRQDEICAGFTTDGALKRFLPRKLSQLKPMASPAAASDANGETRELTSEDGLYMKVFPAKGDTLVNSGVVLVVPEDRFGLVQVALDGIGVTEFVPLGKLWDRWKRVRVRRLQPLEKKTARAFVFGQAAGGSAVPATVEQEDETAMLAPGVQDPSFERIESDEEDGEEDRERRRRRQRRLEKKKQRVEANEGGDSGGSEDDEPEFVFEDLATGRILRRGRPRNTHVDPETRARVVASRRQAYEEGKRRALAEKEVASAVKLQCAWRSKRARENFRQMLRLRAKEKERERLVEQVGAANAQRQRKGKNKATKTGQKPSGAFFSRWRRG